MAADASPDVQLQVAIAARKIEGLDPLRCPGRCAGRTAARTSSFRRSSGPICTRCCREQGERFVELVEASRFSAARRRWRRCCRGRSIACLSAPSPDLEIGRVRFWTCSSSEIRRTRSSASSVLVGQGRASCPKPVVDRLAAEFGRRWPAVAAEMPTNRSTCPPDCWPFQLGLEPGEAEFVRAIFTVAERPAGERLAALDALIVCRDAKLLDEVETVLKSSSPEFTGEVLHALGKIDRPAIGRRRAGGYPKLRPGTSSRLAIDLLMQRERWVRGLLDAIKKKRLAGDGAHRQPSAQDHGHQRPRGDLGGRGGLGQGPPGPQSQAGGGRRPTMRDVSRRAPPAIRSPDSGRFKRLCAQCHAIYGQGPDVGPDLTTNGRASFDQLLSNVFDPSLVIGQAYQTTLVVTADGRNLTGIVTEDNERADRAQAARAASRKPSPGATCTSPGSARCR